MTWGSNPAHDEAERIAKERANAPPQTRKMSLTETLSNTAIGYVINQTAQIILFPLVGIHVPYSVNFALGIMFTIISVARGFCLRRVFEWWRTYSHAV